MQEPTIERPPAGRAVLRVLFVEDAEQDRELILRELERSGPPISHERVDTRDALRAALLRESWDVVLCDWFLPSLDAMTALRIVGELAPETPVIIVSGTVGEETAVAALRAGARDYILKGKLARLRPAIEREVLAAAQRAAGREAAADLALAQARFARLFDAGIIGICLNDPSGRVLDANERFLEMVGFTRDDLATGRLDWKRMTPPEWLAANLDAGAELAREGRAKPWEKEYFRKDGTRVPVLTGIVRLDERTNLAISMDLTEMKRAERALLEARDQLRQSQKMDAIGQLAGGVAHDFNNLLSVILSYTDMIVADLPEDHPIRADLLEVLDASYRAAALTQQLLMFSRRQVVALRVIDLNELILRSAQLLRRLLGEDIELVTELGPPAHVRADTGGLEQVVMNLVVNARDAMPRGGRLVVATSHTEVLQRSDGVPQPAPGAYVTLSVSDTGIGMDETTQLHVFEPFFTTKGAGKGTGLGLSTVFGIVGQAGGRITVESEVGCGTTFRIDLPRVDAAREVEPARSDAFVGGSETVLVVEDEDAVRQAIHGILKRAGYDVMDVSQGDAALALARGITRRVDLLITDVVMPSMSGSQLAEAFRVLSPETKILFISGYTDDEMLRRGVRDGQVSLLQKPITREALLRRVREVLGARG